MGKPCQDCSSSFRLMTRGDIVVSIIADGVGSCQYAEYGSSWAVKYAEEYIRHHYVDNHLLNYESILKEAFHYALDSIITNSKAASSEELIQYDTTLTIGIYDGDDLYYGHSGDGGIIGLTDRGEYVKVTEPQKGSDGISVLPLRLSEYWTFGTISGLSSVLLATDGIYDSFLPYLLKYEPVQIYVPLISYFMDNNDIQVSIDNEEELSNDIKDYLLSSSCNTIQDDMTVAVMINSDKLPEKQNPEYYAEPNWMALKNKWDSKVYSYVPNNKSESPLSERGADKSDIATIAQGEIIPNKSPNESSDAKANKTHSAINDLKEE